jgi:putative ABC transport system substrate-binding protein
MSGRDIRDLPPLRPEGAERVEVRVGVRWGLRTSRSAKNLFDRSAVVIARTPLLSSRGRFAPVVGGDTGCRRELLSKDERLSKDEPLSKGTARAARCGLAAMMRRRAFLSLCLGLAALMPRVGRAERAARQRRIGFLRLGPPPHSNMAAFEEGLSALGYRPGEDLIIERRLADDAAALPALAAELVRLGVEVIFASSTLAAVAAKQATDTIPIVFVAVNDPVEAGLVAGLARPGGNATGLGFIAADLSGKRLQLLREIIPTLSCIAIIANAGYPTNPAQIEGARAAARLGNMRFELINVAEPAEFESAYAAAKRCGAVLQLDAPLFTTHRARLTELAARNELPAMYGLRDYPQAGGFISYGVDLREHYRLAAGYVDKLLKGAKPADLPVELPTKLELVINLNAAKALGLAIPPAVLARADEVIE